MRLFNPNVFAVLLLASALPIRAQGISPSTPPPPPPAEAAPVPKAAPIDPSTPPPPPSADVVPDSPSAPAEPVFDPLHAEKSVEVGIFYLKKGNYDAAINRFTDATHYEPKLAKPWRLLGETYEKKHDATHAVESYKKYLEIVPGAEDAAKITKRIAELEEKAGQQVSKHTTN
jgi:tetratricopeptide (TPR) repeat protein